MATNSFKLTGIEKLKKKMEALARGFPDTILDAALYEGELILTDSATNHVPVDLGTLRNSRFIEGERSGKDIEVTLGYGGAASAYALAVHEHPSQFDPPSWKSAGEVEFSPSGRGPKYLEKPLNAAIPGMASRIADNLDPANVGKKRPPLRDTKGKFV